MSSMSRSLLAACLLTASLAFAWTQDGDASVTFDAKGPAGLKIHGAAEGKTEDNKPKVSVSDDGKSLKVAVRIEHIDTDNSLRNRHMQEDTHAKDHPVITLTVPLDAIKESGGSVEGKGTFELNGQKKETPFTYTPKCSGGACEVEASANLNLGDFGIKIRSYLGVTVKPDIVVGAKFKVKK